MRASESDAGIDGNSRTLAFECVDRSACKIISCHSAPMPTERHSTLTRQESSSFFTTTALTDFTTHSDFAAPLRLNAAVIRRREVCASSRLGKAARRHLVQPQT